MDVRLKEEARRREEERRKLAEEMTLERSKQAELGARLEETEDALNKAQSALLANQSRLAELTNDRNNISVGPSPSLPIR